ncbi:thioesterase II family protein [Umezawaea sp. NPDC059074]|uniref:thioesterase II family protein n=1 Tax=Umezawaea sp. NPDC059074 TaxID=3346716 RepID=UPI0036A8A0EF
MSRWLRTFVPRPDATERWVCFPHAGGSAAAYREWPADLPDHVELVAVQYPGRADRFADPAHTTMGGLVDGVVEALGRLDSTPRTYFGHSMGAAVAYETAVRSAPARLVVSGRQAPRHSRPVRLDGEAALLAALHRFGITTPLTDPELRAMVLATLAADSSVVETYRPSSAVLDCPITAVLGDRDPEVTVEEARDWAELTSAAFDLRVFPGDHFYLAPCRRALIGHLLGQ